MSSFIIKSVFFFFISGQLWLFLVFTATNCLPGLRFSQGRPTVLLAWKQEKEWKFLLGIIAPTRTRIHRFRKKPQGCNIGSVHSSPFIHPVWDHLLRKIALTMASNFQFVHTFNYVSMSCGSWKALGDYKVPGIRFWPGKVRQELLRSRAIEAVVVRVPPRWWSNRVSNALENWHFVYGWGVVHSMEIFSSVGGA